MKKIILTSFAAALAANAAHAQLSAYTPERNQLIGTVSYQYQRYDEFWVGKTNIPLKLATGFREQQQHATYLTLEYSIIDNLTLDITAGYSWTEFEGGPRSRSHRRWLDRHHLRRALSRDRRAEIPVAAHGDPARRWHHV